MFDRRVGNTLFLAVVCFCFICLTKADKEHVEHGSYSSKFKKEHGAGDEHNAHADHEAVLGIVHVFHIVFCLIELVSLNTKD